MLDEVDNLLSYYETVYDTMMVERPKDFVDKNNFREIIKNKTVRKSILKIFIFGIKEIEAVDILIIAISYFERIKNKVDLYKCDKYIILWILCTFVVKYMHDLNITIKEIINYCDLDITDYIYFEKIIVHKLNWKLEVSKLEYQRLKKISDVNNILTMDEDKDKDNN